MEAWALAFGAVARWGIEGACGLGRHTAAFLCGRGHDVRDVSPNRTNERRRARQQGKTDASDAERIAREVLADPKVPVAFKRAAGDSGPDPVQDQLALWHRRRRSLLKSRQHVLNEAESALVDLPETIRGCLPDVSEVRPRLNGLTNLQADPDWDPVTVLRVGLLVDMAADVARLDAEEKRAVKALNTLIGQAGSTLDELAGLSTRSVAELLVETGDPRRFTGDGGFARFNGTAPLPASSAEGDGPVQRHRLNRGGNRRVNAVLHTMAVTQLRCEPRARKIHENARGRGHTKREAMRILKRHLSNIVYRRMLTDLRMRSSDNQPITAAA
jgi:transposase